MSKPSIAPKDRPGSLHLALSLSRDPSQKHRLAVACSECDDVLARLNKLRATCTKIDGESLSFTESTMVVVAGLRDFLETEHAKLARPELVR